MLAAKAPVGRNCAGMATHDPFRSMRYSGRIIRRLFNRSAISREAVSFILNEAVNLQKQCIFIAIPKTGTTSVRIQLKQEGTPLIKNAHLNIMQVRDALYVYFLKNALGKNREFPSESGLHDRDIRAQSNEAFRRLFKFSGVRNPWARAVSLYSRNEGVKAKESMSFTEFCRMHTHASDTCKNPTLHRNQADWLCDESSEPVMDYIYKLENFDAAIREIYERTEGRVKLANKSANRNQSSLSTTYRGLYTGETRRLIAERFAKDIDLFKYSF